MKKIFTLILTFISLMSFSQSTTVVISQVYGGGGNTGAPYTADFVELHNISTASVTLTGYSIQYASAASTTAWTGVYALPTATIPAGGYYLIQMSGAGTIGVAIPTPDAVANPTIAMSGTNGKVALVNGITALATQCPTVGVIDLVGYGSANCSETSPTAALSNTTAAIRKNNGCTETDNNSTDFDVIAPAPRNSATTPVICSGSTAPVLSATTIADFGNVVVLTNSASQSFTLTGSNLTGAPGTLTITSPSTDFQVSNNNIVWAATTTVAYTAATLTSTLVYVRFTPQTVGLKTGNVTVAGGGASTINVAVRGTGIVGAGPVLTAGSLNSFGNICVNTLGGPNSFTITGTNLTTADITVGPLTGFSFSTNAGGPFIATLTLPQTGGSYSNTIFVQFAPTAVQSYSGNIPVSGGGAVATSVAASGAGVNTLATVTTGAASAITFTTATLAGSITASGCSPVTSYGIEYSTTNGFTLGTVANSTNLSGGNFTANLTGLTPATRYYYKAFAINSGGKAYGAQLFFNTSAPSLSSSALADFGSVCVGTNAGPNSFTITSPLLSTGAVTVGPLAGYAFSTAATGPFTPTLSIPQTGGAFSQTVYVQFAPTALGIFDGNIPVSGGGAPVSNVAALGSAQNRPAVVTTAPTPALILSPRSATLTGKINDEGCSSITEYGIVYSGISGFPNSMGMAVSSNNIAGTEFSVTLTGLVPATTYYYKAYAKTSAGISYGSEESFATPGLPGGLVIYNNPIVRNGSFHFSLNNVLQGHYGVNIYSSTGQLVYRKDLLLQVNFIDETFNLPGNLAPGLYIFQLDSYSGYLIRRSFMIR